MRSIFATAVLAAALAAGGARAAETRIGQDVEKNHMEIGAVYLQPVEMEPMDHDSHGPADIHLEADIHATKDNPNGFGPGDWIPYLTISYTLSKPGTDWKGSGTMMAMVANDGPHYGRNVKLDGPGKYKLTYRIEPPIKQGFGRHTDKETGVAAWWEPFTLEWDFTFVGGVGKKGGY
jgi:uncharacterized protein involved in high-affinity Fe2+ transport